MKNIVIDLEMNPVSREWKKKGFPCSREIIQIGAVLLDEDYKEVDHFITLVKPQYNTVIMPKIESLTGIQTKMIREAIPLEEALEQFFQWYKKIGGQCKIVQWSTNDLGQIVKEIQAKQIILLPEEEQILSEWCDLQEEVNSYLGLERLLSLRDALCLAGIDFSGIEHNALCDARNTGFLLKIVRIPDQHDDILKKIKEQLTPKKFVSQLGDLFDFESILCYVS